MSINLKFIGMIDSVQSGITLVVLSVKRSSV